MFVQPLVLKRVNELERMEHEGHDVGAYLYMLLTRVHGFLDELMAALLVRYTEANGINWKEVLDR